MCSSNNKCELASYQDLGASLSSDWATLCADPVIDASWNAAVAGIQTEVSTGSNPSMQIRNPWLGATCLDFGSFMSNWLTFIPTPENGFRYIQNSNYLFRENPAAIFFFNRLTSKTAEELDFW